MKKFKYKAKLKGKKQKGEIDAETLVIAKQKLRTDGYRDVVLTEIKPKKKSGLNAEITVISAFSPLFFLGLISVRTTSR